MEELLTDEDLAKMSEHRFYFNMSLKDRLKIRNNMEALKAKHNISMSKVFRKVMLDFMDNDEFLKYIELIDDTVG